MNIIIEGQRARTTSEYDIKVIRALNMLEGMKKWMKNRVLSFDNTPYNLDVWRQVFPSATIEGAPEGVLVASAIDVEHSETVSSVRPTFEFVTQPRKHQEH